MHSSILYVIKFNNNTFKNMKICTKFQVLTLPFILSIAVVNNISLAQGNVAERLREYQLAVAACTKTIDSTNSVPILGGGSLDRQRFDHFAPFVRVEAGKCGITGLETIVYWTGTSIVPAGFHINKSGQVSPQWRSMKVVASLRDRGSCEETTQGCDPSHPNPPLDWPRDRVVSLRNYPFDIRLPPDGPLPRGISPSLLIKGWPAIDGRPRFVKCTFHMNFEDMNRIDLENLRFNKRYPCQIDPWDFSFRGGSARLIFSSDLFSDLVPALKALQNYLSESVKLERKK